MGIPKSTWSKRVLIVGAGRVGRAIAWALSEVAEITIVDIDQAQLKRAINLCPHVQCLEGTVEEFAFLSDQVDLIVVAVPGQVAMRTLEYLVTWAVPIVDVSFMPEDPSALDAVARMRKIPIVVDCGIAPGWSNIVVGYWNQKMRIRSVRIYVGGLPQQRKGPWEYYAVFSPSDIIEEYLRPARIRRNGALMVLPAMSALEHVEFDAADTPLEAFLTDGLRSLLYTMAHIPDMEEKTLRYPGYADKIRLLQQSGFFATEPLPIKLKRDITLMRVHIEGTDLEGTEQIVQMELVDYYDDAHAMLSMSRCTGFTAAAVVHLLLRCPSCAVPFYTVVFTKIWHSNSYPSTKGLITKPPIGKCSQSRKCVVEAIRDVGWSSLWSKNTPRYWPGRSNCSHGKKPRQTLDREARREIH